MNVLCEEADRLAERVGHVVHDLTIPILLSLLDKTSFGLLQEHAIGLDSAHQLVAQERLPSCSLPRACSTPLRYRRSQPPPEPQVLPSVLVAGKLPGLWPRCCCWRPARRRCGCRRALPCIGVRKTSFLRSTR